MLIKLILKVIDLSIYGKISTVARLYTKYTQ